MAAPCPTFGFIAQVQPRPDANVAALLRDMRSAAAARSLEVKVTGDSPMHAVFTSESSQATEADRAAIEQWLASNPHVLSHRVGPVSDLGE